LLPYLYVYVKRLKRHQQLLAQLPQAFDAIGRAVRAGQTVPAAMRIVADEFESPLSDEFSHCYQQQNLGMPKEMALRNLAKRNHVMELQILVVALLLQSRSGGNLVELLESLATMVRNRIKFQQRVKALTGEGRMQAVILMLLPIVSFAGLLVIAPDYAATLLHHPWLIVATAVSQVIGAIWIRWCVNFEV
jgi:tight adherence protein B